MIKTGTNFLQLQSIQFKVGSDFIVYFTGHLIKITCISQFDRAYKDACKCSNEM